jgi:hypothetical protein
MKLMMLPDPHNEGSIESSIESMLGCRLPADGFDYKPSGPALQRWMAMAQI